MSDNGWIIDKLKYNRLLHYVGCGNFSKADIIIFGNEEGTGGYGIEENVEARYNSFENNKQGKIAKDFENVYWEPSGCSLTDKIIQYLRDKGVENKKTRAFRDGFFLPATARICLALEHNNNNIHHWFQSYPDNPDAREKIISFILNGLFCERKGIQTALTDWRHLPRPNEKDKECWNKEYKVIDRNLYLRAYNLPKNNNNLADAFTNYSKDVGNRKQALKSALGSAPAKIIIGFGNIPTKQKVIQQVFEQENNDIFNSITIKSTPLITAGKQAEIEVLGNKKYVFLLPFPEPRSRIFGSNKLLCAYLEEFTEKHLKPIINQ